MPTYLLPVARHLAYPERFLLRDDDERWYVWKGEDPRDLPEEIADGTAFWLLTRAWIIPVSATTAWVHVDDLPLAPVANPAHWS